MAASLNNAEPTFAVITLASILLPKITITSLWVIWEICLLKVTGPQATLGILSEGRQLSSSSAFDFPSPPPQVNTLHSGTEPFSNYLFNSQHQQGTVLGITGDFRHSKMKVTWTAKHCLVTGKPSDGDAPKFQIDCLRTCSFYEHLLFSSSSIIG